MNKKYSLQRENIDVKSVSITNQFNGYKVKPRDKVRQISKVNSVMIVNPSFINKVLKKKIKKKLDYYLQYIIDILDDSSEDNDDTDLKLALNDVAHFKSIIEYKYSKYLDQKYISLLLKKLNLLEHELKLKVIYKQIPELEKETEEKEIRGKSR